MHVPLLGLHHVTATVDDAQADLDFASEALGLRLVKKTVNFDNNGVYHFYYGDERGSPGTLWTTFPYRDMGVPVGTKGAGQVTVTSFSVPTSALPFWARRFKERGMAVRQAEHFGEASIVVQDPSGLLIELVGADRDARAPWLTPDVSAATAVRGLHSVTMTVQEIGPTLAFMQSLLGVEVVTDVPGRLRVGIAGEGPGHLIDILHGSDTGPARNGLGTVHHVAMAITDADAQLRLREELVRRGVKVTPVMDRQYFTSIYFREPGGVLFEVATRGPGFLVDEPLESLGRGLKLPPWVEPSRPAIEAALPPVRY
jgi:glyoxalase family protein